MQDLLFPGREQRVSVRQGVDGRRISRGGRSKSFVLLLTTVRELCRRRAVPEGNGRVKFGPRVSSGFALSLATVEAKERNGGEIVFAEVKRRREEGKRAMEPKELPRTRTGIWTTREKAGAAVSPSLEQKTSGGNSGENPLPLHVWTRGYFRLRSSSGRHQELRGADKGK
ncbi:hypothetical protein BJX62DRAFT_7063 [Aspergillus germanicus]